jgi:fructose-bisphosphate aldolase class II
MPSYSEFGFVNTKKMFEKAIAENYCVPAFNFNDMTEILAITTACIETRSPVIIANDIGSRDELGPAMVIYMVLGALKTAEAEGVPIPIALHLDHGPDFQACKSCIDSGFSSVMIDGSHFPYEQNIAMTKEVVDYAHQLDVTVEGELGVIAGHEGDSEVSLGSYTDPNDVEDFVSRTGVDSLAIAIGTNHGAYKFKVEPGQAPPPLRFDILQEIIDRLPDLPIVLHGASAVPQDFVALINEYGGIMENAIGVPEDQLQQAAKMHVVKVNIHSDAQITITGSLRKYFAKNPSHIDPRQYMNAARRALVKLYKHKITNVLGSAGRV